MKLEYTVSMHDPNSHYFEVSIEIRGFQASTGKKNIRLLMPVWTPGSHRVLDYAENVQGLEAREIEGQNLEVKKIAKNGWEISLAEGDNVVVRYRVFANSHTVSTSYLDSEHALINGASVFLFVEGREKESLNLQVRPYASWSMVSTIFGSQFGAERRFGVPNYGALIDSPIEIGNQYFSWFPVEKARFEISVFSPLEINTRKLVQDIRKVTESTVQVFGGIPFNRYLFLLEFGERGNESIGHPNSSLSILSYFRIEPPHEYRRTLSNIAHALLQAWNMERMNLRMISSPDYSRDDVATPPWIADGIPSYYEIVVLRRSGIMPIEECLDSISARINRIKLQYGAQTRTLEDSIFDAWTNQGESGESSDTPPMYSDRGALIACMLDLQIRRKSSGKSLDDVMKMLSHVARERGYTYEEFRRVCDEISEGTTSEIFEKHVRGLDEIDLQKYIDYAGMELVPKDQRTALDGFLGIRTRESDMTVISMIPGCPAQQSGLSMGDEIIAANDIRVDYKKLRFLVASTKPGTKIQLTIAREGVLWETQPIITSKPIMEYRIQKKRNATDEEKQLFQRWMSEGWETPLQYENKMESPVTNQVFDYI